MQSGLAAASVILQGTSFHLAWQTVGIDTNYLDSIFVGTLTMPSELVRITPAGLGVLELITGLSAELVGIGTSEGIVAAFIVRVASLSIVLLLGPLFSYKIMGGLQPHQE
jgi:uncharacterized membrane protein YbhN (UPF0104 family)